LQNDRDVEPNYLKEYREATLINLRRYRGKKVIHISRGDLLWVG